LRGAGVRLLDSVPFRQIVTIAENLDIIRVLRRATFGIRDDVIEVKSSFRTTIGDSTHALVSLPDFDFDPTRNDAVVIITCRGSLGAGKDVIVFVDESQFELEDSTPG
jgi:hypothetical protein